MRSFASKLMFVVGTGALMGLSACGSPNLHPSFGQLYRDVNMAQLSAHPAHEPTVRGNEIQSLVGRHDNRLSADTNAGGTGSTSGAGGNKTAGIPPLH